MKGKWQPFRLALVALLLALGAGCGGLRASHSISPASFFLPGLGKTEPAATPDPIQDPIPSTDQIPASVPIVAQAQ